MPNQPRIAEQLQALAVPLATLHHDPTNARTHGVRSTEGIKRSLAEHGQLKPIVVQRQGMIVRAGNGLLAAARELGWIEIAAVVVDMDDATATRFAIADNRVAEFSEWDDRVLATLLESVGREERLALGFDDVEFKGVLDALTKDDAAPGAPPADPDAPVDTPAEPGDQLQEPPPSGDSPGPAAGHEQVHIRCPNCHTEFTVPR